MTPLALSNKNTQEKASIHCSGRPRRLKAQPYCHRELLTIGDADERVQQV